MTWIDWLQWIGFAFVLAGYWGYGRSAWMGFALTTPGSVALASWGYLNAAWGVLALQFACFFMMARPLYKARRK